MRLDNSERSHTVSFPHGRTHVIVARIAGARGSSLRSGWGAAAPAIGHGQHRTAPGMPTSGVARNALHERFRLPSGGEWFDGSAGPPWDSGSAGFGHDRTVRAVVGSSWDELLAGAPADRLAVDRPLVGHLARAPRLTTDHETPLLEHNVAATLVANGGRVAVVNVRSAT